MLLICNEDKINDFNKYARIEIIKILKRFNLFRWMRYLI